MLLAALPSLAALLALVQASDSLTLQQALDRARRARPNVAVAAAGVDRARGARRVGAAIPNPTSQFEGDDFAPTRKATVVQPLAWLARRGADLSAGRAGVERAAADSAQLMADVAHDVRRAFFGSLAAEEQLRLAGEQSAIADSLVILADRRVSAGDIAVLERDQVAQEAARARLAMARAREDARVARIELARAVAWERDDPPRAVGLLAESLGDETDAMREGGAASDIARAPAMRAAIADSSAAAARLRAARIARIPIPSLLAGREWGGITGAHNAIIGFALPLPLWSQGNEAVAEARGAAAEGAAMAAESRLTVAAAIGAARVRVSESARRARFANDSLLPEARRIRGGAVRLYESGRTGILPVFDALRAERDVARAVVQELLAFQQARAELAARLGRWP